MIANPQSEVNRYKDSYMVAEDVRVLPPKQSSHPISSDIEVIKTQKRRELLKSQNKKNDKRTIVCQFCYRTGHRISTCWYLKRKKKQEEKQQKQKEQQELIQKLAQSFQEKLLDLEIRLLHPIMLQISKLQSLLKDPKPPDLQNTPTTRNTPDSKNIASLNPTPEASTKPIDVSKIFSESSFTSKDKKEKCQTIEMKKEEEQKSTSLKRHVHQSLISNEKSHCPC